MKNSWQTKKLEDVCNIVGGGTPSKINESFYTGKILWATVRDMKSDIIEDTEYKITEEAIKNSSTNIIPKNNVIIATRVGLGKVCFSKYDMAVNQDLKGIIPRDTNRLSVCYLYWWLKSTSNIIEENGTGATVQGVKLSFIKNLRIPLPSLLEQKRIVKILDEVFEEVGKAKENAEKNLRNSRELFESYLQSVFENKGEGWGERRLGDVCGTGAGGTPLKSHKEYYENGEVPWLRSGEVNKKEVMRSKVFISEAGLNNSSARMFPINTVLIAMYGATAGQVGILKFASSTNQAVCGILPNKKFSADFLYYVFLSKKKELVSQAVGGAQPNISQIKIKDTFIPVLELSEQKAIVKKLDALSEETKKLEEIYKKEIADLEELKKSVLQKAFRGEL
ncbi:MAG: restriction endonuclease subunit S [Candidatus Pacebacteria bacterium]|nr:restriction endonuclease subunit S [Candidatus Paceibacterota bacterium]